MRIVKTLQTRKRARTKSGAAAALFGTFLAVASISAEPNLTTSAKVFGGYHEEQGSLVGGGLSFSGSGKGLSLNVELQLTSLALKSPVLYAYGTSLGFPLSEELSGNVFCRRDGFDSTLGCGGGATFSKGPVSIGAGSEYRPGGTISIKASLGSKLKLTFLSVKAKLLGFLNTNSDGITGGGADVGLEVCALERLCLWGRYNYFTKGDPRGRHAVMGSLGAKVRF